MGFSRHRKSIQNAFIKAFNMGFRQEYLYEYWSLSLEDAEEKTD